MKIGYVRVSAPEQNTARQDALMQNLGVERVYLDTASGKDTKRPQLQNMLDFVREGDTVIVESISRFARNTKDFLDLIQCLSDKKVAFISRKEAIDTSSPAGKFMLTVFAAVAELERDYILQRQREGIEEAKKQGKYKGRKPIAIDEKRFTAVIKRWQDGEITAVHAQKLLALSPSTFYRRVRAAGLHSNGGKA